MLQSRPRDSYVLATKLYVPMDDTGENQGLSSDPGVARALARARLREVRLVAAAVLDAVAIGCSRSPTASGIDLDAQTLQEIEAALA